MSFGSAQEAIAAVEGGRVRAIELAERALAAIEHENPRLGAFLTVSADRALEDARRADEAAARGEWLGPLHGIPVAVKDLQETRGIRTTYGSRLFRSSVPDEDATIVERLRRAGATIVGKTNTPAFGALGETMNRLGEDCRNPVDPTLTPGGSSGGSAAAVGAGLVTLATGTDSAGSIACPASFCGIVGMKPSRGRIPQWPSAADSRLLSDAGVLSARVADAAFALAAVAGPDPRDPLSIHEQAPDFKAAVEGIGEGALAGLRIAVSSDLGHLAVEQGVVATTLDTAATLADLGATLEQTQPQLADPLDVYMPIYATDFRHLLASLPEDATKELFPETLEELDNYPPLTAEEYVGVLNHVWQLRAKVADFFEEFDLLVTPATACPAFPLREPPTRIGDREVIAGWRGFMPFQVPWNLTGSPSICVPGGSSNDGRPIGVLLVGRLGDDVGVLRVAAALELARLGVNKKPTSLS